MPLTILYAEDHAVVRLALKEMLEREDWRVEACADGNTALARLEGGESYACWSSTTICRAWTESS